MSRRLTALLCTLCLLTGCGASSARTAPDASASPAEQSAQNVSSAPVSSEPEAVEESSGASESADASTVPEGGSMAGLSWEFETKKFSTTDSSGREVYYDTFQWPVFSGEGSEALNEYLRSNYLGAMDEAEAKSGVDDSYLDGYKDYLDEDALAEMLPFFDLFELDTVWADEDYVSISGIAGFWSGGAHPYTYHVSTVVRRSDALSMSLDELMDTSGLSELVRERFPEDAWADDAEFRADMMESIAARADEPEAYVLEDGGVRLYYNVGDAVPRLEIFLSDEEWKK